MKRVAVMQPHYLPYLGYFQIMANVDEFYFYTGVQHARNSWQVKNRLRTPARKPILESGRVEDGDGIYWLCVPVRHPRKPLFHRSNLLRNIMIDNTKPWSKDHLKAIVANYSKSPHFMNYYRDLESLYSKHWDKLLDLDVSFIRSFFMNHLDIKTPTLFEHTLDYDRSGNPSQRIINFCEAVSADVFLEPGGGRVIFNDELFKRAGIEIRYFHYEPIIYEQLWPGFVPWMCMLDTLMCLGDDAKKELEVDWLEPGVMVI